MEYSSLKNVKIDIKLHPREKKSEFQNFLKNKNICLLEKLDIHKSVEYSIVVGILTFVLIESKLHGGRAISCQFTKEDTDFLNYQYFNIPICKNKEFFFGQLDEYIFRNPDIKKPSSIFDGLAANRLCELINYIIGDYYENSSNN